MARLLALFVFAVPTLAVAGGAADLPPGSQEKASLAAIENMHPIGYSGWKRLCSTMRTGERFCIIAQMASSPSSPTGAVWYAKYLGQSHIQVELDLLPQDTGGMTVSIDDTVLTKTPLSPCRTKNADFCAVSFVVDETMLRRLDAGSALRVTANGSFGAKIDLRFPLSRFAKKRRTLP
jgi:invasion protein IalB